MPRFKVKPTILDVIDLPAFACVSGCIPIFCQCNACKSPNETCFPPHTGTPNYSPRHPKGVEKVILDTKATKFYFRTTLSVPVGIPICVGSFATEREAAVAYDLACHAVGRAPVNFPDLNLADRFPDAFATVRGRLSKILKDRSDEPFQRNP